MNIILIEPFFTGSHRKWALELKKFSSHNIEILSLPGRHWKWRMHGGAISLSSQINAIKTDINLIVVSDMLDLTTFKSLLNNKFSKIPILLYFHENQLSYPWSTTDKDIQNKRNLHYSFINYTSALCADQIAFNSNYHQTIFLKSLKPYLEKFPDHNNLDTINEIKDKSSVLKIAIDLKKFDKTIKQTKNDLPIILWNHRWEEDKNPDTFFKALFKLKNSNINFKLIVTGQSFSNQPAIFNEARSILSDNIIHWGYCESFQEYATLLEKANIELVCSNQDFFGISAIEAIYSQCFPILPNRLAFPEHLNNEKYYYNTNEEMYNLLKEVILQKKYLEKIPDVSFYDWSNQIEHYDSYLNKIVV